MTHLVEKALAAVRRLPANRQGEAAALLLALDRLGDGAYVASAEELVTIDEALAQTQRGEFATDEEVEAAFARCSR